MPTNLIDSPCYLFKMVRIYAPLVATDMVDHHVRHNWPNECQVTEPMGSRRDPTVVGGSIAVSLNGLPDPASIRLWSRALSHKVPHPVL